MIILTLASSSSFCLLSPLDAFERPRGGDHQQQRPPPLVSSAEAQRPRPRLPPLPHEEQQLHRRRHCQEERGRQGRGASAGGAR